VLFKSDLISVFLYSLFGCLAFSTGMTADVACLDQMSCRCVTVIIGGYYLHCYQPNTTTTFGFYHTTHMHSAVYTVVRCLSVRLSVCHTGVLSQNNRAHHQAVSTGV